jgi:hypothetical protein
MEDRWRCRGGAGAGAGGSQEEERSVQMVGMKISERNPEYAAPEGFYCKMKKLMQHPLELA